MVGALEAGLSVLTTPAQGILEYIDEQWVRTLERDRPLLAQITAYAGDRAGDGERIRHHWRHCQTFSLAAFVDRVSRALNEARLLSHLTQPRR